MTPLTGLKGMSARHMHCQRHFPQVSQGPVHQLCTRQQRSSPRIISAESGPGSSNGQGLVAWLRNKGATVGAVELEYSKDAPSGNVNRALVAKAAVDAGACLVKVPKSLQVRYDNVEDPCLLRLFARLPTGSDTGQAAWQFKQALTLLHHELQGINGPLHGYLSHLPGKVAGIPTPRIGMLMDDAAVQELQYAPLVQDVQNHKYWWDEFSRTLANLPDAPEDNPFPIPVSRDMFGWAVAVVISRCFGLSRARTHVMVPLIDMANHVSSTEANCEIRSTEDGSVSMYAKRKIATGEALALCYGPHDNHHLLLSYGFTIQPSNPSDRFWLDIDVELLESLAEAALYEAVSPGQPLLRPWQRDTLRALGLRAAADAWTPTTHVPTNTLESPLANSGRAPSASQQPSSAEASAAVAGTEAAVSASSAGADAGSSGSSAASFGPNSDVSYSGSSGGLWSMNSLDEPTGSSSDSSSTTALGQGQQSSGSSRSSTSASPSAPGAALSMRVYLGGGAPVVDPRLLAAVRIVTLGPDLEPLAKGLPINQLGEWNGLLARQHEITVMQLLVGLVTAIYKAFPTTIQQDQAFLANTESPGSSAPTTTSTPSSVGNHSSFAESAVMQGGDEGCMLDLTSPAARKADLIAAVRSRLGMKRVLERCLQAVLARVKELDSLQQIR